MASRDGSSVLADTHVLIWYMTAPDMLSTTALRVLEDAVAVDEPIVIAAVSLIELVYIAEKRSDSIDAETLRELLASIQASDSPIAVAPMTVDVAHQMTLVSRAQVRDPFDRAIVATAQVLGLPLLTRDGTLTRHFPELCVW
ncbi:MAG: type II toxin-antitoxin system VapC family toxin [Pseudonocardiaceae bacterium]